MPEIELAMIDGVAYWREQAIANGHVMSVAEWQQRALFGPILVTECSRCHASVYADYAVGKWMEPAILESHINEPCPGGKE